MSNQKAKKTKKFSDKEKEKKQKELLKSIDVYISDFLPYKGYIDNGYVGFKLTEEKYCNVFSVIMYDYYNMIEEDVQVHESVWDKFFRTIDHEFKFNSLNLPLDTRDNVNFFTRKKEQTQNPLKRRILDEHIQSFQLLKNKQVLQTYLFVFADSEEDLITVNRRTRQSLSSWGLIKNISPEEKIKALRKINNHYC